MKNIVQKCFVAILITSSFLLPSLVSAQTTDTIQIKAEIVMFQHIIAYLQSQMTLLQAQLPPDTSTSYINPNASSQAVIGGSGGSPISTSQVPAPGVYAQPVQNNISSQIQSLQQQILDIKNQYVNDVANIQKNPIPLEEQNGQIQTLTDQDNAKIQSLNNQIEALELEPTSNVQTAPVPAPVCSISTPANTGRVASYVTVSWTSSNATSGILVNNHIQYGDTGYGFSLTPIGQGTRSIQLSSESSEDNILTLSVTGPGGTSSCSTDVMTTQ